MDHLLTEARNPASVDLDALTPLEIVRLMNAEDAKVAPAVGAQAEAMARAVEVIAERLRDGPPRLRGRNLQPARRARRVGMPAHVQLATRTSHRRDRGRVSA